MHWFLVNDFNMFANVSAILYSHQRNAVWSPKPKRTANPTEIQNLCESVHEKREICPWTCTGCSKLSFIHRQPSFVSIENERHFSYKPNHQCNHTMVIHVQGWAKFIYSLIYHHYYFNLQFTFQNKLFLWQNTEYSMVL